MSETINGRLGLYGAECLKYNHGMMLGFKGLTGKLVLYDVSNIT